MSEPLKLSDRFAFDRFTVCMSRREVLADGVPVELGGRTFDLLIALIEARGRVVSKDELLAKVWPKRIVEENNLQAGICALRRALGAERELIRTVAGRGYQFAGAVRECAEPDQPKDVSGILPRQADFSGGDLLLAVLGQSDLRELWALVARILKERFVSPQAETKRQLVAIDTRLAALEQSHDKRGDALDSAGGRRVVRVMVGDQARVGKNGGGEP